MKMTDLVALTLLQVVALGATSLEEVGTLLAVTYMVQSVTLFPLVDIGMQQSAGDDSSGGTNSESQRSDRRQRHRLAIAFVSIVCRGVEFGSSCFLLLATRCADKVLCWKECAYQVRSCPCPF